MNEDISEFIFVSAPLLFTTLTSDLDETQSFVGCLRKRAAVRLLLQKGQHWSRHYNY